MLEWDPRPNSRFHTLGLHELSLWVKLGVTDEERSRPQEVRVSLKLRFSEAPRAASTDRLEHAVCYAALCDSIRAHCEGREFRLIERLAAELYELVRERLKVRAELSLTLHKLRPPYESLLGGASYQCGDFLS